MIGTTLSHFKITAKLGEGGMGEVYRATDTKLGREVALKVLPADMADSAERLDRFRREAMTLASLDHPGIVHVYSIEEADGLHFLTMQLIEGESLDLLIPEGGLAVDRILEIARALAEALAVAHDKGIVHRDLKPTNVMVTGDGRVKVLDFGLAKFTGPQSEEVLDSTLQTELRTSDGVVMGTVPYMSPEQLSGLQVDHRSDIFSLGVILYEMGSGERPFQGRSSVELASAILRDTSQPLDERRADLPPSLGRVIERCLAKNIEDRFPSARDLGEALSSVTAEAPLPQAAVAPASRPASEVPSGAVRQDEGFWVAVLPFKCSGSNADLAALAEALPEEIATGLSRFSYLRVVAHGSTAGSVKDSADARYIMEGSLRHAGTKLRLAVQLVDATTGAHLWAENYERTFSPEAIFELQDDLVPRIVSTVADMNGVLPRSMGEALRSRSADQLSPYEAVLRSFAYFQRVTAEELAAARSALEVAVEEAPTYTDAWAMLALLCAQEYGQGFNLLPDPLATGAAAARRAVEEGPTNPLAHFSLAQVLFFQREFQTFRNAVERASSLNPMDGNSIAFLGELLTYSGDSERGLELAGRAKQLNPHHPGWYWFADFYHLYNQRDYPAALDIALKVNLPGHWGEHCATAAAAGQVGNRETAEKALRKLLELRPDIADIAHQEFGKWWNPEFEELMIDGLRKAGLGLPSAPEPESSSTAAVEETGAPLAPSSGATRADEGFWVAVLPFKSTGTSTDLDALAEGLSEEIVAGLSRFSYLRVIGHGSTQRYAGKSPDMRTVGQELGARYVMNGSLRQAGSRLRTAVQLIDASTGAQLWSETYERPFSPEAVFELQDDLVPRIVSTVADIHGVLPHSMSEAVRLKSVDEITPYEALLRSFGYNERFTPEDFAEVTACLERAVQEAPGNADLWAMLSLMYANEYGHWGNPGEDCLPRALETARKAVEVAPLSSLPYYALAQALFFHRDIPAFRIAAERSVELNPMDGATAAWMGLLIAYAGDWERGCALSETGLQLNPNHPGMYRYTAWHDAYRKEDYAKALDIALQLNAPKNFYTPAVLAMCYAQLGQMEPARKALRDLLELKPDYAEVAQELHGRWILPDLVEHLMQGLRKAGLDVPPAPMETES